MIYADELIAKFELALDEGWGYIWGKAGQTWTEAMQKNATNDMAIKYGKKWIGKMVADCSGLLYGRSGNLAEASITEATLSGTDTRRTRARSRRAFRCVPARPCS